MSHCIASSASPSLLPQPLSINHTLHTPGTPTPNTPDTQHAAVPAAVPDSAPHTALLTQLSLAMQGENCSDAISTSLWFSYLGLPQDMNQSSQKQWLLSNETALRGALGTAIRSALPPSRSRDALQMGLEEDLHECLQQLRTPAATGFGIQLSGAALRLTEYVLTSGETPVPTRPAMPSYAATGLATLMGKSPAISGGLTISPPLSIDNADLKNKIRDLLDTVRKINTLAQQHHSASTGAVRNELTKLIDGIKNTIASLSKETDPQVKTLLKDVKEALKLDESKPMWGWRPHERGFEHFRDSAIVGHDAISLAELDAAKKEFQARIRALPGLLQEDVFAVQNNRMMPAIEKAKTVRDDAASALTLKPSDAMTLANLHQKQADYNVLFQALSSALRHEQRIAEMLINNITR